MKLFKRWFNLIAALALSAGSLSLLSCGGDNPDPEPKVLKVNPTSISMLSAANASVTISITCTDSWTITDRPDWINLSSTSGNGNTSVVITALTANETSKPRTGMLTITSGDLSAIVELTQLAGLQTGCEVTVVDEVIMFNCATFKLNFGSKASYYKACYLPASSAGWPDSRIVALLEEDDTEAMNAESGSYVSTDEDLTRNTSYIQCFVAYDANGNRGDVVRKSFTTPNPTGTSPRVFIKNIQYSSTEWTWQTEKNATTTDYFMFATTGNLALAYFYAPTSLIGMFIKETADDETSYINDRPWYMIRTAADKYFYVATWARRDLKWSDTITDDIGWVDDSSSSAPKKKAQSTKASGKMTPFYKNDRDELMKSSRIIKL